MTINVHDMSYFESLDVRGGVIKCSNEICFGVMSRSPSSYLNGAKYFNIYMAHYSSRKSTQVFIDAMYECGMMDKNHTTFSLVDTLPKGVQPSGIHEECKRFIKLTFEVDKISLQKMYVIYMFVRMLQNEPKTVYYIRRWMNIPMDFFERVCVASALCGYNSSKLNVQCVYAQGAGGFHAPLVQIWGANPRTTAKEYIELLDKHHPPSSPKSSYHLSEQVGDNYMVSMFKSLEYKFKRGKVVEADVLDFLKHIGGSK
jgi:hypothetical protein